jgi:predicted RNA-binding protein YlqC (UPF0109 family)
MVGGATGARVAITLPRNFIAISPPEAADAAMTTLASRRVERPFNKEFSIPVAFLPRVFGRSGETLKSIEQSCGARVSINRGVLDDVPVGFVRVSSRSQEAGEAAVAVIRGITPLSNTASKILVSRNCIGRIIGRAGASLKALEAMTGCQIVVSKEDADASGSVWVFAHGPPSGEQHALSEINSVQNGASSYWGTDL